jgi:hypothetical protein
MCSPATCPSCGKASYTGCGQHVDQVLAGVPAPTLQLSPRCAIHQRRLFSVTTVRPLIR